MKFIDPPQFPPDVLTPAQKAGLAYQRKVGRFLTEWTTAAKWSLLEGPWLAGPCQPDFLLISPGGCVLVVEAKLTQTDCTSQFAKYRLATGAAVCVQICRRLIGPSDFLCLEDAVDNGVMLLWV